MEVIQLVQQQTTMVMVLELAVAVEVAAAAETTATSMQIRQRVAVVRPGLPKMRPTKSMMMRMALVPKVPHQIQVRHHEKMTKVIRVAEVMATKKRMRGWFAIIAHQH